MHINFYWTNEFNIDRLWNTSLLGIKRVRKNSKCSSSAKMGNYPRTICISHISLILSEPECINRAYIAVSTLRMQEIRHRKLLFEEIILCTYAQILHEYWTSGSPYLEKISRKVNGLTARKKTLPTQSVRSLRARNTAINPLVRLARHTLTHTHLWRD